MLRQWKRWESGEHTPSEFYQPIIAATFGTVTHAIFPATGRRDGNADILAASGMDTLELVSRMQAPTWTTRRIDGVAPHHRPAVLGLPVPGQRPAADRRPELAAETERAARPAAHSRPAPRDPGPGRMAGAADRLRRVRHRQTARSGDHPPMPRCHSGAETDNAEISAWAHEMRAWMALTTGDYHGVVVAAQHGIDAAPHHSVAVQLAAQEAKAWARIGDRRQTEVALDRGRRLLDSMPYPENLDHHFVVDPTKFDFYAMDCYRHLGDDPIAETLADEVIEAGTDFDGTERAPMRIAEARITLGVVAARQGELEQAVQHGERALCWRAQVRSFPCHGQPRPYQECSGTATPTNSSPRPTSTNSALSVARLS